PVRVRNWWRSVRRLALLLALGACQFQNREQGYRNGTVPHLFGYSAQDIDNHLADRGIAREMGCGCRTVTRTTRGDRLYCVRNGDVAILSTDGSVELVKPPAPVVWMNDDARFVAWTSNFVEGISLADGFLPRPDGFGIDRRGVAYYIQK